MLLFRSAPPHFLVYFVLFRFSLEFVCIINALPVINASPLKVSKPESVFFEVFVFFFTDCYSFFVHDFNIVLYFGDSQSFPLLVPFRGLLDRRMVNLLLLCAKSSAACLSMLTYTNSEMTIQINQLFASLRHRRVERIRWCMNT